jgi:hypothetical protein
MAIDKAKLFSRVAIAQLHTRAAGVIRGTADGTIVCPKFLHDVATITDAIVQAAEEYDRRDEPQLLKEARQDFQRALDEVVEQNRELLTELKD